MADLAFTSVLAKEPKDGKHWTLGVAERNVPGYTPVKETGEPADPFYVAKFPTRFATKAEADAEAAKLNRDMFGLSERDAIMIVASSMGAQRRGF